MDETIITHFKLRVKRFEKAENFSVKLFARFEDQFPFLKGAAEKFIRKLSSAELMLHEIDKHFYVLDVVIVLTVTEIPIEVFLSSKEIKKLTGRHCCLPRAYGITPDIVNRFGVIICLPTPKYNLSSFIIINAPFWIILL